jgi:hypothetical protein
MESEWRTDTAPAAVSIFSTESFAYPAASPAAAAATATATASATCSTAPTTSSTTSSAASPAIYQSSSATATIHAKPNSTCQLCNYFSIDATICSSISCYGQLALVITTTTHDADPTVAKRTF